VVGADDGVRTVTVGLDVLGRMAEAVSGVSRMREFRRYVADTAGRRLVQLWMDIERFHRIDAGDERSRWLLYREIQITFYEFHEAPSQAARNFHDANCVLVGTSFCYLLRRFCRIEVPKPHGILWGQNV